MVSNAEEENINKARSITIKRVFVFVLFVVVVLVVVITLLVLLFKSKPDIICHEDFNDELCTPQAFTDYCRSYGVDQEIADSCDRFCGTMYNTPDDDRTWCGYEYCYDLNYGDYVRRCVCSTQSIEIIDRRQTYAITSVDYNSQLCIEHIPEPPEFVSDNKKYNIQALTFTGNLRLFGLRDGESQGGQHIWVLHPTDDGMTYVLQSARYTRYGCFVTGHSSSNVAKPQESFMAGGTSWPSGEFAGYPMYTGLDPQNGPLTRLLITNYNANNHIRDADSGLYLYMDPYGRLGYTGDCFNTYGVVWNISLAGHSMAPPPSPECRLANFTNKEKMENYRFRFYNDGSVGESKPIGQHYLNMQRVTWYPEIVPPSTNCRAGFITVDNIDNVDNILNEGDRWILQNFKSEPYQPPSSWSIITCTLTFVSSDGFKWQTDSFRTAYGSNSERPADIQFITYWPWGGNNLFPRVVTKTYNTNLIALSTIEGRSLMGCDMLTAEDGVEPIMRDFYEKLNGLKGGYPDTIMGLSFSNDTPEVYLFIAQSCKATVEGDEAETFKPRSVGMINQTRENYIRRVTTKMQKDPSIRNINYIYPKLSFVEGSVGKIHNILTTDVQNDQKIPVVFNYDINKPVDDRNLCPRTNE
jgi:hypothetical protein